MFVDKFNPEKREDQTIIVSGESGAGKTESTKQVLHFLAVKSSDIASEMDGRVELNNDIEHQIVASNPILESIGNAKTTRNNNSSRFGKFIELQYCTDGYIEAGVIRTYMLESVRVTAQLPKERNFHVFYELNAGLSPDLKNKYGLTRLEDFCYTNQSGEMKRYDGESDAENYGALKDAMCTLDIDESLQGNFEQVVVAILHLGNLQFQDSSRAGEDVAEIGTSCKQNVDHICSLLGISEECLVTAVSKRSVSFVGNVIQKTLNAESASYARHTLARYLYATMFQWIVVQINLAMASKRAENPASFVGVLDIFGFEHFAKNSFEQLCINYTNEKLQDHFNFSIFKSEQEVYREEGLNWTFVNYPDNSVRLELLEHPTVGVFAVINEQIKIPKSSDEKLATALYQRCGTHVFFGATKIQKAKSEFTILHYARDVTYQTAGMLDKNRTETANELTEMLSSSLNPLMQEFAALQGLEIRQPRGVAGGREGLLARSSSSRFNSSLRRLPVDKNKPESTKKHSKESIGKKHTSVAAHFSHQLNDLITKIRSTRSHFVCCIKPNSDMKPLLFNVSMATNQLRCGGALGAIKVFRAGFSNRMSFESFVSKFSALAFVLGSNIITADFQAALIEARATASSASWKVAASRLIGMIPLVENIINFALDEFHASGVDIYSEMQMGITQIFLRATAYEYVEKQLFRVRNLTARRLQIRWKIWHQAKSHATTSSGMMAAQLAMRYFGDYRRRKAVRRVVATITIQRRIKVYFAVKFRKFVLASIRKMQAVIRGVLYREKVKRIRNAAARVIQCVMKGFWERSKFVRLRKALIACQKRHRGRVLRRKLQWQRQREGKGLWAVLRIQSIYRGQHARGQVQQIKRAKVCMYICFSHMFPINSILSLLKIAKKFDDQMKAAMKKQEMLVSKI
jgi:myosin-5